MIDRPGNGAPLHELWTPADTATYLVDADSTAITVETLDFLAGIVMSTEELAEFHALTNNGMQGTVPFDTSLERRFALMRGVRGEHVREAAKQIADLLDPTLLERREWIAENPGRIHIVSGGFEELIGPAMARLGIDPAHVHANRLIYDNDGFVIGADADRLTSRDRGKAALVASLKLKGLVVAVGDGINDYQIKDEGLADYFIAYTGHAPRDDVVLLADAAVNSFAEPLLT